MRSIWKGHIRFSLVTIPIQVFSAINSGKDISFRQLHNKDKGPIKYSRVCKACDEEVSYGDIVKGYEYEPDNYVIFEKDDLDHIKLKSTKAVDIEAFVDLEEVHPSRFEAIYFVGPSGEVAKKTFSLFTQTLKNSKKAGVGRIILREKEDVVLLVEHKGGLIMYKLRYPYEMRSMDDVPDIEQVEVDKSQLELAETLVKSLSMPFEKVDFSDRYREALMELVQSKIEGKQIISINEETTEAPVVDIMSVLKKSIEAAKKKGA